MAKGKKKKAVKKGTSKLYTLTEVSQATGISMPTLQRYKKSYQERIPSVGEGRTQRYPKKALAIFEEIKKENMAKRGRPKKSTTTAAGKASAASARKAPRKKPGSSRAGRPAAATGASLLSLSQIQKITGISYPTLSRYVKLNLAKIPHVGEGRKRRYMPDAVDVFTEMRKQSRRGRRSAVKAGERALSATRSAVGAAVEKTASVSADLGKRIQDLESAQAQISRQLKDLLEEIRKPIQITLNKRR